MTALLPAALFDRYPSAARPTSPLVPLGNAGGLSGASLWRFDSTRGPLVARAWPVDGPDSSTLARIHAWIARAGDLGFLPVPVATLDGRTLISLGGRNWEVAPWMTGVADLARPPTLARLRAAFAGLAAFHARQSADRSEGPSPGLISRAREIEALLAGEFAAIDRAAALHPADARADLARRWIARARGLAPGLLGPLRRASTRPLPLQPCLRDARPDHFLFEGDRLTGLVDFGAMGRESVAADLARLLGEGVGADRVARAEALAAYESIRPLASAELAAIDPFLRANALLGAGRWATWHFLEGRTFEDPDAVARGLRRGLDRLAECFDGRSIKARP